MPFMSERQRRAAQIKMGARHRFPVAQLEQPLRPGDVVMFVRGNATWMPSKMMLRRVPCPTQPRHWHGWQADGVVHEVDDDGSVLLSTASPAVWKGLRFKAEDGIVHRTYVAQRYNDRGALVQEFHRGLVCSARFPNKTRFVGFEEGVTDAVVSCIECLAR